MGVLVIFRVYYGFGWFIGVLVILGYGYGYVLGVGFIWGVVMVMF